MKVVINTCFGGFGLSHAAMMRYGEIKGTPLYAFTGYRELKPLRTGEDAFSAHYSTSPTLDEHGQIPTENYVSNYRIERTDPALIQVVEELGKAANGQSASLKVVEIPEGVDYEIDEYDGREHIAEKHRTWA